MVGRALAKAKRCVELHTVGGRAEFDSVGAGVEAEPGDQRGEAGAGVPTRRRRESVAMLNTCPRTRLRPRGPAARVFKDAASGADHAQGGILSTTKAGKQAGCSSCALNQALAAVRQAASVPAAGIPIASNVTARRRTSAGASSTSAGRTNGSRNAARCINGRPSRGSESTSVIGSLASSNAVPNRETTAAAASRRVREGLGSLVARRKPAWPVRASLIIAGVGMAVTLRLSEGQGPLGQTRAGVAIERRRHRRPGSRWAGLRQTPLSWPRPP